MTWIWVGKNLIFFVVFWEKLMDNYESEIWVWYDLMGDGIACKIAGLQHLIICWKWWIQESSALQVAKLEDHLPAETAWTDNSHRKGMNPQCIRQKISRILKDVEIFRNLMRQLPNYICHRHPPHQHHNPALSAGLLSATGWWLLSSARIQVYCKSSWVSRLNLSISEHTKVIMHVICMWYGYIYSVRLLQQIEHTHQNVYRGYHEISPEKSIYRCVPCTILYN